jgi:hypothetical protein
MIYQDYNTLCFENTLRSPQHKSDLGLSKGMPQLQKQYTSSCWWPAESKDDERTPHASSKSTLRPSQCKVHKDYPKKPSQPRGKPHSGASNAHDKLKTHKVSKCPSVTKMPKSSWHSDNARPLDNSSQSPGGFSDNVLPIQSVPETHKVSVSAQTCPASKSIWHNDPTQSDRDTPSFLEPNASNIHHVYDILETHKVSYHTLPAPASKPQCDDHQGPSSNLPQLLRSLPENNCSLHQDTTPVLSDARLQSKVPETTSEFYDPIDAFGRSYQWTCLQYGINLTRYGVKALSACTKMPC